MECCRRYRVAAHLVMPDLDPNTNNSAGWEDHYQRDHIPWDRGEPHPELIRVLRETPPAANQRVLVPGCGRGHDALAWAEAGHQVTAVDISPTALALATQSNPHPNITWLEADLFALPKTLQGTFDLVWEHTSFCAVHPDQRTEWAESMARALRPGGTLLGVFFTHPDKPLDEGPPFACRATVLPGIIGAVLEEMQFGPVVAEFERREGAESLGRWRR